MKKINAFLIFCILFFSSCTNQFMPDSFGLNSNNAGVSNVSAGDQSKIVVSGKIELKGAVPQEILNSQSRAPADDGAGERTAMPVIPSGISYVITAKKGSDVVTADADSSGSFSLTLTEGSWDISAEGFVTSGGTAQRILKGSYINSSTSNKYVVSNVSIPPLDIKVNPISSGEGKGDVYLTINLSGCDISSYRITWTESGVLKTLSYNAGGTIASIPFCMIADGQTYASDRYKDVGSYEVLFEFFSDTSFAKKVLVYRDVINVFENLQTTEWINSGNAPFINSGGSFTVTPAILKTLQNRHDIYVRHGASGGTGSYYEPYGTLADAVTAINTCNDGDPYNIYLMSDYTASQDEIATDGSLINFNNTSSTPLNVVIRPYGASRRIIDANRTSTTGTVLYMSALSGADTSVTLKNVSLQGGKGSTGGDQILVGSNSKLTLGSGAVVTGGTNSSPCIYLNSTTSSIEINGDACVNSMNGICIQHNTSIILGTDFAPAKDSNGNTIQTSVVSYYSGAAIEDKILSDNVSDTIVSAHYNKFSYKNSAYLIDSEGKLADASAPASNVAYISAGTDGNDTTGNGSLARPYATLLKALESFTTPKATDASGNFENTVYVLTDYTITQGCNTDHEVYANIVGCKNGTANSNVTFICKTPSDSALYVQNKQKYKISNINFCTVGANGTSAAMTTSDYNSPNVYATISVTENTELTLEDCSIQHLIGKDVSAINIDGNCTLINCAVKNNYTINTKASGQEPWGCSVLVKKGELHVSGTTSITDNRLYTSATAYVEDIGVWIGHSDGTAAGTYYNPIVVDDALTGTIYVTPYSLPGASDSPVEIATGGYTGFDAANYLTKFTNSIENCRIVKIDSNTVGLAYEEETVGLGTPLTIEAAVAGALVTFDNKSSGSVIYKKNGGGIIHCNSGETAGIMLENVGDKVQFFGDNLFYATHDGSSNYKNENYTASTIACSKDCYVYGNIMSLIDSTGYETAKTFTKPCALAGLFMGNTHIKNATGKDLYLPATTLSEDCYTALFYGCTGLTSAPALPANTLKTRCYYVMFYECANLVNAPVLPASTLADYCYSSMFQGCTSLTAAPDLSATVMKDNCYSSMFQECTSLTAAPDLPSTAIASNCYKGMFKDCTNLTTVPELPATTLASYCYQSMFSGCSSLTTAPDLPATTLADSCYEYMFYECTGLTTAPALPATTLANSCYEYMFCGCTGLTTAPELSAETLTVGCYSHLFSGCTNLNSVTCLATNISATDCTKDWLYNVAPSGIFTKAPSMTGWTTNSPRGIPTGWTVQNDGEVTTATPLTLEAVSSAATVSFLNKASGPVTYKVNGGAAVEIASGTTGTIELAAAGDKVEFYGNNAAYGVSASSNSSKISCTADCYVYGNIMSLINSSSYGDLTELTQTYTFAYLFYNNSKIKNKTGANLLLPATTLADDCYKYMFYGCTGLTAAPALSATTLADCCYQSMFNGCTGLTAAPELPATTLAVNCYYDMFHGCIGLTAAPELPATTLADDCYKYMFYGCTGLTAAPELPATTLASNCYEYMFNGCTGLTSAPELPATTLANSCYNCMFKGCTGLTAAPELPATTLANYSYCGMFQGCTNLNSITCLATDISASSCVTNWLSGVASTGTFTKAPAMTGWTLNSASGIPIGWTVVGGPTYLGSKAPGATLAVGDIVFSDGSAEAYSSTLELSPGQKEAAVAVIFYTAPANGIDVGTKNLGVGLKQGTSLAWANNSVAGYSTRFELSNSDGNLNWGIVQNGDPSGTADPTNYPAFNWCNTYGVEVAGESSGWYLPAWNEIRALAKVYEDVNNSINKIGTGTDVVALGGYNYWSSSQDTNETAQDYQALKFHCTAQSGSNQDKKIGLYVRAIREF